jgi:hypothetical protein
VPALALPLVPLVIIVGSSITGGTGVAAVTVGGVQMWRANKLIGFQDDRLTQRYIQYSANVDLTNAALCELGRVQEIACRDVILRMEAFLLRHGKQVRVNERLVIEGMEETDTSVPRVCDSTPDVMAWVEGLLGSAVAGIAAPRALRAFATRVGKASTGTALYTLHGAVADNAVLAFFAGGSRAAGGLGKKLGGNMLNLAGASVSLLAAGITVKNQGSQKLTAAEERRTQVDIEIARLDKHEEHLRGARRWAHEQSSILGHLMGQATEALDKLEAEPFSIDLHSERLQTALILVTAVGKVVAMAAVDDGANEQLLFKYRTTKVEEPDG